MEDVLEVYALPDDPTQPMVCFDECSKQLVSETRTPIPAEPGQPVRYDYAYQREGVANMFMFFAPFQNWRHVDVTERRTKANFAYCMRDLVDVHFPDAVRIRVVLGNLNTHTPAALYTAFSPDEARRIIEKLEFHSTPKHGSWLNMAEIELSVLAGQCLDRRIDNQDELTKEVTAWADARNAAGTTIDWRFTTEDARIRLKKLYPVLE